MRIILTGPHGSGKTTMLKYLSYYYPSIPSFPEAAVILNFIKQNPVVADQKVEEKRNQIYKPSEEPVSMSSQYKIFDYAQKQLEKEYPVAFYDRSVVDVLIYTQYFLSINLIPKNLNNYSLYQNMQQFCENFAKKTENLFLFLEPPEICSNYQKEIYNRLLSFLETNAKKEQICVVPPQEKPEQRAAYIKSLLDVKCDFENCVFYPNNPIFKPSIFKNGHKL